MEAEMKFQRKRGVFAVSSLFLAFGSVPPCVLAQSDATNTEVAQADTTQMAQAAMPAAAAASSTGLTTVIVTGTRQTSLQAAESPAPIQILSAADLERASGDPTLIQTLANIVPSLTAQAFGGDMANQTLLAK